MMVKVCGITRREDALVAAEAGASAIGFIFYPKSPRYVQPEKARALGEGIEAWKVGVFVDESPAHIESVMQAANLDVAQIYGPMPERYSMRIWQAIRLPGDGALTWNPGDGEALFLDGAANGVSFDWPSAKLFGDDQKIIIAGGLNPSNVAEAIRIAHPWGVDASSGLEISPGIKDHEKVRQFIKAAQELP
jgi:phosphoribosylanthranilate isomerase